MRVSYPPLFGWTRLRFTADFDEPIPVAMIGTLEFVVHLGAVFPPLHQAASYLLAGPGVHTKRVVRNFYLSLTSFNEVDDQVRVFGAGSILLGFCEKAYRVNRHHDLLSPRRTRIVVFLESVEQHRSQRLTHADILDCDQFQP